MTRAMCAIMALIILHYPRTTTAHIGMHLIWFDTWMFHMWCKKSWSAQGASAFHSSQSIYLTVTRSDRTCQWQSPPFLFRSIPSAPPPPKSPTNRLRPRPEQALVPHDACVQWYRGRSPCGHCAKPGRIVTRSCRMCHGALARCRLAEHEAQGENERRMRREKRERDSRRG